MPVNTIKSWLKSFRYAFQGLRFALAERNFRFHLISMLLVCVAGIYAGLSLTEWMIVTICIGTVLAAEIFNTAIEHLVNMVSPEQHPLAGKIKDLAAAAVLVTAIAAAVAGLIIFLPKIIC